jgi:hypothetical protein
MFDEISTCRFVTTKTNDTFWRHTFSHNAAAIRTSAIFVTVVVVVVSRYRRRYHRRHRHRFPRQQSEQHFNRDIKRPNNEKKKKKKKKNHGSRASTHPLSENSRTMSATQFSLIQTFCMIE